MPSGVEHLGGMGANSIASTAQASVVTRESMKSLTGSGSVSLPERSLMTISQTLAVESQSAALGSLRTARAPAERR